MPLTPGTRVGHYEITVPLGKGGMGEVYRARDPRLNRDVALKVLPPLFANDPERMARFEREARVLASLNHPNIAQIYGIEERALVMELVEGPTLAERIKEGAMPLDEALPAATQIAEAFEYAHDKGVVHRDLKPANVKITPEGVIKILDFGLAKALDDGPSGSDPDNSPTLSMHATRAGVILGTAAYMAPEQARGKKADRRSDIWAFGVVLYEMLTGQKLFRGEDLTEILASVVKEQPDLSAAPPEVRKLLDACLQKEPKKRLQSIGDWKLLVEPGGRLQPAAGLQSRPRVPWIAAGVATTLLAALAFAHFRESPPEEPFLHLSVSLPENGTAQFLEIAPNGRVLLLVTSLQAGEPPQILLRSLDSPEWRPLSGTDNARVPFWSPDSRFIAFFAEGKLKKIPAAGGPAQDLCGETRLGSGGAWNRNGVILFGTENGKLLRVDAAGGTWAVVGKDDPDAQARTPTFLPDGNHFFYVGATQGDPTSRGIYLSALDDPTPHKILADFSSVVYAPPVAGGLAHLLFLRENALMAQPFDDARLETVDDPFLVASQGSFTFTSPKIAASVANGTLVYLAGRSIETQFTWFDRSGKELAKVGPRAEQSGVTLSPDGNAVLTGRRESNGQAALWLYDLARGSESRFLPLGTQGGGPLWYSDSSRVLLGMTTPAGRGLHRKDVTGGGQPELVLAAAGVSRVPSSFSRDGKFFVYTVTDPRTRADIWYLPWSDKPDPEIAVKFLATDATESQAQLSPDEKWIAYSSSETGRPEVYIRPFPMGSGIWKVSVDGGREPRWSADSRQLYFVHTTNADQATLILPIGRADYEPKLRRGFSTSARYRSSRRATCGPTPLTRMASASL